MASTRSGGLIPFPAADDSLPMVMMDEDRILYLEAKQDGRLTGVSSKGLKVSVRQW